MSSLLEDVTHGIIVPTFQRSLLFPRRKVSIPSPMSLWLDYHALQRCRRSCRCVAANRFRSDVAYLPRGGDEVFGVCW